MHFENIDNLALLLQFTQSANTHQKLNNFFLEKKRPTKSKK